MAEKEFIEGTWSRKYEYVEIFRDDHSCRKRFKLREEEDLAEAYYNHLQSLDNQLKTYHEQKRAADEQKRAADELEALRKATEEKNRIERERPFRPPFPPPPRQVLDPEYQEWLEFKKATDPEFAKWKREKEETARRLEEARRRAAREAEQKRIADELVRKKKEDESRRKKEEELRPYEDDILNQKTLSLECRLKVAKETFREEVMLQCVYDLETSVVHALMRNPNITDKVRKAIDEKKEAEKKKLADEKARKEAEKLEEEQKKERIETAIWWIVGLAIAAGLIFLVVQYWETILAILVIIFLLYLFLE